jgi:hypothetical protein
MQLQRCKPCWTGMYSQWIAGHSMCPIEICRCPLPLLLVSALPQLQLCCCCDRSAAPTCSCYTGVVSSSGFCRPPPPPLTVAPHRAVMSLRWLVTCRHNPQCVDTCMLQGLTCQWLVQGPLSWQSAHRLPTAAVQRHVGSGLGISHRLVPPPAGRQSLSGGCCHTAYQLCTSLSMSS